MAKAKRKQTNPRRNKYFFRKVKSVKDLSGILLLDVLIGQSAIFRDKVKGEIEDYKISYLDLEIKILSDDAVLYEDKSGRKWIDYSHETLGYEVVDQKNGWTKFQRADWDGFKKSLEMTKGLNIQRDQPKFDKRKWK